LACAKADAFSLMAHPAYRDLSFAPGTGRIEKMNLVGMLLRFADLAASERRALADSFPSGFPLMNSTARDTLLRHGRPLCLASDAFIPFRDNVDRAAQSYVTHIVQTGGSLRDVEVTRAADEHGLVMIHTGKRYFLH
jgi:phosphoribosylaminoimidazolecarboxamide formyltransferase/IMP cyclohydrolase/phosphoribosylaminoimidazolecarboxamide formyltransferase